MEHMHFKRMRNVCAHTVGRFMVFALLLFLLQEARPVYGQTQVAELNKQLANGKAQVAELNKQLADGKAKVDELNKQLADAKAKVDELKKQLEDEKVKVAKLNKQLADANDKKDFMTPFLGCCGAIMVLGIVGGILFILMKSRDRKPVPSSQLVSMDTLRKELSAIIKTSRPEVPAVQSSTKKKQQDEALEKAVQERKALSAAKEQLEANLANAEKERDELSAEKKQLEENLANAKKERDALSAAKEQLEAKLANAKKERDALSAAKEQLEANLAKAEEESGKRKRACEQEKSGREVAERQLEEARNEQGTTNQKLVDAQRQCETLKSKMYPKELLSKEAFGILKGHLEEWLANQSSGALLARAELQAFGTRALLPNWPLSLNNLAIGISAAMRDAGKGEQEVFEELNAWSKFLGMFSDTDFDFSLRVPKLGENIDRSWMHCKNRDSVKVQKIISWAVFHNEKGIQSSAEVE